MMMLCHLCHLRCRGGPGVLRMVWVLLLLVMMMVMVMMVRVVQLFPGSVEALLRSQSTATTA